MANKYCIFPLAIPQVKMLTRKSTRYALPMVQRLLLSVMKFLSMQQRNIWMKQHRTVL